MLRAVVLFLLLANGVFFAWSQGLLAAYGLAPGATSEPQRLAQQIRPEMVLLLPPRNAEAASAPASVASAPAEPTEPTECLTAGLFDMERGTLLAKALADALPAGSWSLEPAVDPGRWIVYMGRYPSTELLERKKAELRGMRVKYEALEFGLSLGVFSSEAAAQKMLAEVTQRGVRTARVVPGRPAMQGMQLRLPEVNAALKAQLDGLKTALDDKPLRTCDAAPKTP